MGIDLGTTNSAIGYVDSAESQWKVRTFRIPQLIVAGQVEPRETLPSFHYQPAEGEFAADSLLLPWDKTSPRTAPASNKPSYIIGAFARDHGVLSQGRLIDSAKSWLCHPGVDRTAELLPWHGVPDVQKLSPVEVTGRYLKHMHDAWNAQFPSAPLAEQDIILTLPASFDEIARELTVKGAALAGLSRVVLIEEPQAAFYAWINRHRDSWEQHVSPGQTILVCDIGGGTSDFTLIRVRAGQNGKVQFQRVAVGEHLILGGDNLDLALARHLEQKLMGERKLEPRQWGVLVRTCRKVKETLLGHQPPEQLTVHLPGSGSRLIGGGLQVDVTRSEVEQLLTSGFVPDVDLHDQPSRRRSGFQEFGLPYAADPAITKYLAAFLNAHRDAALDHVAEPGHDSARPDIVLFNGGFFASAVLREQLLKVLRSWFQPATGPAWSPLVLDHDRLDLAVAHGAAYYGMVRRGFGVRISAGLARTYYIGVDSEEAQAICLIPAGTEPGQNVDLTSRTFELLVSQPVEFPLFVSSTRLTDMPGAIVPVDREQMTPLPPIRTVIRSRGQSTDERIIVQLHARLTEIGTLDLWCATLNNDRRWKLQFDVRSTTQTDITSHGGAAEREGFLDESVWERCRELIVQTFGGAQAEKPESLVTRLTEAIETHRGEWPSSLLRRMWEILLECEPGRRISAVHEARWLNLLGFSLRPGYGLAADDWRVNETRRTLGQPVHPTPACLTEWWILWRRICGGLTAGQQRALANVVLPHLKEMLKQTTTSRRRGPPSQAVSHQSAEMWRLLGALELMPISNKVEIGRLLTDALVQNRLGPIQPALLWTLGRIGARQPVYGPLNAVVSPEVVTEWLQKLIKLEAGIPVLALALMQLARKTDDRYRDVPETVRESVVHALIKHSAPEHFIGLVRDGGTLDAEEQGLIFGESLPKGLRIQ